MVKPILYKPEGMYTQDSFEGGINFNSETATSNQVADSRNMWAPVNVLESRPGTSVYSNPQRTAVKALTIETTLQQSGVYSNIVAGNDFTFAGAVGDTIYVGTSSGPGLSSIKNTMGSAIATNTNLSRMVWEYYNGEAWVSLRVTSTFLASTGSETKTTIYWSYLDGVSPATDNYTIEHKWTLPADITYITINSRSKQWVRMRIMDAAVSAGSAAADVIHYKETQPENTNPISKQLFKIKWLQGDATYVYCENSYIRLGSTFKQPSFYYKNNFSVSLKDSKLYNSYDQTVLPEYGLSFISLDGYVFDFYKNSMTQPLAIASTTRIDYAAQVETDQDIIGDTEALSALFIPQESIYPHSKYLLWINSTLFHAASLDNPYLVRWSAPSSFAQKGFAVWPKTNQTVVLGDDLSPITGLKAFGEHPIVLKRHSMWRLAYVGPGQDNLGVWEAVRVSGGVGTVNNNSVQITPVGMVHVYEDGIYVFDGVNSTKVSGDRIQEFWDENINLTDTNAFISSHWRSKHCYLLSIPTKDRAGQPNNKVIIWDYVDNAWWIWDNLQISSFLLEDENNASDQLFYTDHNGSIFELTGNHDNGTAIDAYITTHRFGYKDNHQKQLRQVYLCASPEVGQVLTSVITNDREEVSSGTMTMTDPKEALAGSLLWNQGKFINITKKRIRHLNFRERGKWFQIKAEHNVKNKPFRLTQVQLLAYQSTDKVR